MASKQIHYNIDNISKINANFNLIYGEKSNGKSYQVKHKKAIIPYLEECEKKKLIQDSINSNERFILLRRWKEDINNLWIEQYFSDVDIEKLTNGKYNCISCYRKVLYLSIYDVEQNKIKRFEKIGYVMALSTEQHYSGGSFLDVKRIIFEEFMERGSYIPNEPDKLMTLYSTIDRKRGTTEIWMVGNSISRICPYIPAWGLEEIFRTIKQGEIKTKVIHNEENDVTIAIEYCKASGGKTMAIGNASGMIDKGGWQTFPQPKLPKSYKNYKVLLRIGFKFKSFRFIGEFLQDKFEKDKICWFIYPKYSEFTDKIIVISDEIKISRYWQRDIYNLTIKNQKLQKLFIDTFRESNIFYSDDLCGTDFKQAIDFLIRR